MGALLLTVLFCTAAVISAQLLDEKELPALSSLLTACATSTSTPISCFVPPQGVQCTCDGGACRVSAVSLQTTGRVAAQASQKGTLEQKQVLPENIGELRELKLLDLSGCGLRYVTVPQYLQLSIHA